MKRFTETAKWSDPWFQDLSAKHKLFWTYICDTCDPCGVWKVNLRLAGFQIGDQFEAKDLLKVFASRIEDLGNGYWFVSKFCSFQYGTLSEKAAVHRKILKLLDDRGLTSRVTGNGLSNPSARVGQG